MNSFALWYENNNARKSQKTDIHINVCKIRNHTEYIEFGILIHDYEKDWGSVCLSVPFSINKNNIEDLSIKLHNSTLISALFNEQLSTDEKSKFFKVKSSDGTIKFKVMEISDADITFTKINNHTAMDIKISEELENNRETNTTIYLRFRINKIGKIFQDVSINKMLLDGYKEKKGIFEVNMNMKRKLPVDIKQHLKQSLHIKSINLFLITDYDTDILFESTDRKSARVLENYIWEDYVGYKDINIEKVVAYQWKSKESQNRIKDFNIFVKTLVRDKSNWIWTIVIIFILFLGIIGGVSGNFITSKFFNGFQDSNISCEINSKGDLQ